MHLCSAQPKQKIPTRCKRCAVTFANWPITAQFSDDFLWRLDRMPRFQVYNVSIHETYIAFFRWSLATTNIACMTLRCPFHVEYVVV